MSIKRFKQIPEPAVAGDAFWDNRFHWCALAAGFLAVTEDRLADSDYVRDLAYRMFEKGEFTESVRSQRCCISRTVVGGLPNRTKCAYTSIGSGMHPSALTHQQGGPMTDTSLPGLLVDLPLPPQLPETLGYRGNARFVGFYWSPLGDQLVATDGINSATGQSWAYIGYKRHRAVFPLLEPFDLGSSEEDAVHMLLIDRTASRASIAPVDEARTFLESQHPPAPELTPEQQEVFNQELERLLAEWRERPVDHEAIAREMAEQRGRVGRMMAWLEMCPVPEQGQGPARDPLRSRPHLPRHPRGSPIRRSPLRSPPRAGATEVVVQVIGEAKRSIHVAAYGFTSEPIAEAARHGAPARR